jgi:putative heme-binding domain-containing protein
MDLSQAAKLTAELLADAPADFDPTTAAAALLAKQQGAKALTAAIASQKLSPETAKRLLRVARSAAQPSAELIAGIQKAGGLNEAVWKLTPELTAQLVAEVPSKGDPARGEAIYRMANMQCLKCHSVGGAGGLVGPDLVSIGATAQLDYLIESLITPASKVKENYHSKLVLDDTGRVYTGIPIRDTKEQLVLRDAEDKLVTLAKDSIEQIKDGRSLMPDGLVDTLTRQELVDLVSFLSQLGKVGGNYTLGQSRFVRRWQVLPWTKEANSRLNRTSYDSAASDEPVFEWTSAYSRVAGDLPLAGLPEYVVHRDNDPVTFLRAELDVTTPGRAMLVTPDIAGLTLWIDGKPALIADHLPLDLTAGRHTLTFAVNRKQRQSPLAVSIEDVKGSPAQLQIVGGK